MRTLIVWLAFASIPVWAGPPKTVTLSGRVIGASGRHIIYVALWNENGFLKTPVQRIRIDPQQTPAFQFQIPPGRWALSAFEDENANGVLDMGAFGPKEPSGFWRPFHAWRKPRFDDVAAEINQNTSNADIKLSGN
ncbi:MAG: DUF2141 domain-containing protein [Terracidiphilus sp.]